MPKDIRPTQNICREALFDIINEAIVGASFLDLFAGSGAVGFEALSRGAGRVVMVEKDQKCADTINENAEILFKNADLETRAKFGLISNDAFASIKQLASRKQKFDLIFIDPPFGRDLAKKALKQLNAYDILQPNCTIIAQHDRRDSLPEISGRFRSFRQKKYGSSLLTFYEQAVEGEEDKDN